MKEFLSITKKINKMKTAHLMEEIYRCQADIITFYTRKRRKSPKELDALYNRMSNEKFVKALKKIVKSDELELNPWFVVVITGFTTYAMHLPEDERIRCHEDERQRRDRAAGTETVRNEVNFPAGTGVFVPAVAPFRKKQGKIAFPVCKSGILGYSPV